MSPLTSELSLEQPTLPGAEGFRLTLTQDESFQELRNGNCIDRNTATMEECTLELRRVRERA